MNRTFTKGKLKKKISYAYLPGGLHNVCPHAVSMHGSDRAGHIRIERERYEEFTNEKKAKKCFRQWAAELIAGGWECLECEEVEERDKREEPKAKSVSWNSFKPKEKCEAKVKEQKKGYGVRKCEVCGAEFEAHTGNQRFCCRKCKEVERTKRRRGYELGVRKCKRCGNEFMPTRSNQIYCSKKCTVAASSKRRYEKLKQERNK